MPVKKSEQLSAREGANRVARRFRENREQPSDDEVVVFKCEDCGGEEFRVERILEVVTESTHTVPCRCGEYEYAAQRVETVTASSVESSRLDDDHRCETWDSLEKPSLEREAGEIEVTCLACFSEAEDDDWKQDKGSDEPKEDDIWVKCGGCGHEVEFGWSHPDRAGRIWPCEASDFNPWRSWPEPRYREPWHERGWLRPNESPLSRALVVSIARP